MRIEAIGSWSNAIAPIGTSTPSGQLDTLSFLPPGEGQPEIFQTLSGDQVDGVFAAAFLSEASFNSRDSFSTR